MHAQVWTQVSTFRKLHKSEAIQDYEKLAQRAKWRVAAVLYEKKMVAEIKKTQGISKISACRTALQALDSAGVPDKFVNEHILAYGRRLVKK